MRDYSATKSETNLIVGDCADRRDDELSIPRDVGFVGSEVGVLVQDAGIFLAEVIERESGVLKGLRRMRLTGYKWRS